MNILKGTGIFVKDLRVAEKCSNFATANGEQRQSAGDSEAAVRERKIENNDMMPQDKQRRPSGRMQQRQRNTG